MTTHVNPFAENANELLNMEQLRNRHMLVRTPRMAALIHLRGTLLKAIRTFMEAEDFVEVTTPTITSLTGACEDFSTLFPLDYFGNRAFLTQTAQLHLSRWCTARRYAASTRSTTAIVRSRAPIIAT